MPLEDSASGVLNTGPGHTEADIRQRIGRLLTEMDMDEFHLEYRIDGGAADIYLPRQRAIVEVKRNGLANDPDEHLAQLDRYLRNQIAVERGTLFGHESDRRWVGILTDGQVWHHWNWPHRDNPASQVGDRSISAPPMVASWFAGYAPFLPVMLWGDHGFRQTRSNLFRDLPP